MISTDSAVVAAEAIKSSRVRGELSARGRAAGERGGDGLETQRWQWQSKAAEQEAEQEAEKEAVSKRRAALPA